MRSSRAIIKEWCVCYKLSIVVAVKCKMLNVTVMQNTSYLAWSICRIQIGATKLQCTLHCYCHGGIFAPWLISYYKDEIFILIPDFLKKNHSFILYRSRENSNKMNNNLCLKLSKFNIKFQLIQQYNMNMMVVLFKRFDIKWKLVTTPTDSCILHFYFEIFQE